MPATTSYGVELAVELAIGRAADAGLWGVGQWGRSRWGDSDTIAGDWVDVTCDVLDGLRLTAGSNTDDGVTRRWESASAAFTLDGDQWDPWNGPHKDVIGDRTPARVRWRYPDEPGPPAVRRNIVAATPSFEAASTAWVGASNTPVARDSTQHHTGAWSLRVNTPGVTPGEGFGQAGAQQTPVTPGTPYTASLWVLGPAGVSSLRFQVRMSTAGGVNTDTLLAFTCTGAWQRVSQVLTPAAGQVSMGLQIRTSGTAAVVFYVDDLMIEPGNVLGAWFDGSTPDTPGVDYAWDGAPQVSASRRTAQTTITHPWVPAFTGYIATRGYSWDPDEAQAQVACVDGTSVLVASDGVAQVPAGAGESAAARVARILATALWPGPTDITAGGTALQATPQDAPAWSELLEVADTDLALLWVNRAGALSYRPRGRVGQGTVLSGRLVVCEAAPGDLAVMTMGRNQPSVTRNRVWISRRKPEGAPTDPPVSYLEDRQSIARYQAHDYKRTDLWHTDDGWSATLAQAVIGAGSRPSPAPGQVLLDSVTGDARVPVVLLGLEPDMTYDVVDDTGTVWREAVVGWDVQVTHGDIEGVLQLEDVTRWTSVGHWGTAHWGTDRWGIGGI